MTKYIASCSGGKDSVATLILAKIHGEPLDEVIYCEVMYDQKISGERPEHQAFIYEKLRPWVERELKVPFTVVRSKRTFLDCFNATVVRGPDKGLSRGFPLSSKCYVNRDCKMPPIKRYFTNMNSSDYFQYVGIASDEPKRLKRLEGTNKISLLDKYRYSEDDAKKLCEEWELLSPIYEFTNRNGCWFCPNCKKREWESLCEKHPELFNKLIDLEKTIPNHPRGRRMLTRSCTPSELKKQISSIRGVEK